MRRFIVDKRDIDDAEAVITGYLYRHMAKVLRLKQGTAVMLTDGEGGEYEGVIESIDSTSLRVRVVRRETLMVDDGGPQITIYQGLPKGDKLEYILQKCTELGAAGIVPFAASRSIARISPQRSAGRVDRWQKIAAEAARQSRRATVPRVSLADDLSQVLQLAQHSVKLLLWEEEKANLLRETLSGLSAPNDIGVLIGPEGGFSPEEAAAASSAGFIPISMGRRIVRTETASLIILSILQYHWGDLG
ncbi:16S rRNA (uridine1498-N3-)-methyltransferase [Geotalea daltonii FRC-32]|uniref:Ribosomal RNA small subunit methyltransferase E n=1 Tax=Geotalea daltonii (strain DSM 22248 / JCM 15807 / FRC-32) TaxID=316067 RepID=B9LZ50_GEODF|nr:16S rRNA (uracil(1498)-N(3))-methyltransferase [Geotalea daltonii]ACM18782.1 16S rRNA (uridine1498-N3-)-methyltransferase [Geotalea daltonii FRC-32]